MNDRATARSGPRSALLILNEIFRYFSAVTFHVSCSARQHELGLVAPPLVHYGVPFRDAPHRNPIHHYRSNGMSTDPNRLIKNLPRERTMEAYGKWMRNDHKWHPMQDGMEAAADPLTRTLQYEDWAGFRRGYDQRPFASFVADAYFQVDHDAEICRLCDTTGYNKATEWIWRTLGAQRVTPAECARLADDHRWRGSKEIDVEVMEVLLWGEHASAERRAELRAALTEIRARERGVWGVCEACDGRPHTRLGPDRLVLCLWMLDSTNGTSRGVLIRNIAEPDLSHIRAYLRCSFAVHQDNFRWLM